MSINQLHKDITGLLYKVEEDYSKIIQHGDHVPLIELDIVLKDIRLLYEYFNELKIYSEEQRRKAIPKDKTQEGAVIMAADLIDDAAMVKASLEESKVEKEHFEIESEIQEKIDESEEEVAEDKVAQGVEELPEIEEHGKEVEVEEVINEETQEVAVSEEEQKVVEEKAKKDVEKEELKPSPIAWQTTFDASKEKPNTLGAEKVVPPVIAPKIDLLKEREKDFVPTVRKIEFKKEVDQPEPKKESIFEKAASLYDKISKPTDKSIAAHHSRQPISNIKSTIGINDKFIYLKELFKGNVEEYGAALDKLNDFDTYADAEDYFQELKEKYEWDSESKSFQGLAELLMRRYL